MSYLRKYAVATDLTTAGSFRVRRQIRKAGSADYAVSADWTPATGDVQLSKDGGAFANVGTLPAYTNGAWQFTFTAAELTAKTIEARIVDSATKAVDDDDFLIETFGHASAMYPTVYSGGAAGNIITSGTGTDQIGVSGGAVSNVTAVGSVSGAVGSVTGNVGGNVVGTVASVVAKTGYSLLSSQSFDNTGQTTALPADVVRVNGLAGGARALYANAFDVTVESVPDETSVVIVEDPTDADLTGWRMVVVDDPSAGPHREITGWNPETRTLTFSPGISGASALAGDMALLLISAAPSIPAGPPAVGPGASRCTIRLLHGGTPVADADVWLTSDLAGQTTVAGTLQTDSGGRATFLLDAGNTYYLWAQKDGWQGIRGQQYVAVADP